MQPQAPKKNVGAIILAYLPSMIPAVLIFVWLLNYRASIAPANQVKTATHGVYVFDTSDYAEDYVIPDEQIQELITLIRQNPISFKRAEERQRTIGFRSNHYIALYDEEERIVAKVGLTPTPTSYGVCLYKGCVLAGGREAVQLFNEIQDEAYEDAIRQFDEQWGDFP